MSNGVTMKPYQAFFCMFGVLISFLLIITANLWFAFIGIFLFLGCVYGLQDSGFKLRMLWNTKEDEGKVK